MLSIICPCNVTLDTSYEYSVSQVNQVYVGVVNDVEQKVDCDPELSIELVSNTLTSEIRTVVSHFGKPVKEDLNLKDPEVYALAEHQQGLASRLADRVKELTLILDVLPMGRIVAPGDGNGAMLLACMLMNRACVSSDPFPTYLGVRKCDWRIAVDYLRQNDIVFFSYCAEFFFDFGSWLKDAIARGVKVVVLGTTPFSSKSYGSYNLQSWYSDLRLLTGNIVMTGSVPLYPTVMEVDHRFFRNAFMIRAAYVSSFRLVPWVQLMARVGLLQSCWFDSTSRPIAEELTGLWRKLDPEYQIIHRFDNLVDRPDVPRQYFDLRTGTCAKMGDVVESEHLILEGRVTMRTGKLYHVDHVNEVNSYDIGYERRGTGFYVWIENKRFFPSRVQLQGVRNGGEEFSFDVYVKIEAA